jgi:arylsulfatase A-like enzyme
MQQIALSLSAVISAATLVAAEGKASGGKVREADERPNVLMICIDDLNDWTGFLGGHPDVQTPHMDKLAKSGRNFTNAHCTVPVCSCSRISVMSGLAATTHGSYEIGPPYQGIPLLKDYPTIHRYFKNNGYTTLSGGKVLHHGFSGSLSGDLDQVVGKGPWPNPRTRPKVPISRPAEWSKYWDWGPYPETNDTAPDYQLAVSAAKVLKQDFGKPFFMSVGFFRPHVPLYAPKQWFDLYDINKITLPKTPLADLDDVPDHFRGINQISVTPTHDEILKQNKQRALTQAYLASVSFVDHCVGTVLNALADSPHAKNTIVVLWSDHGFHLGEKRHWSKRTLWEESTRVPFVFFGPGIKPGAACRESVSLLDIYPTLVKLCSLPANKRLEGLSLIPQIDDPATPRKHPAIISSYQGNHAVRSRDWRLISYADGTEELYHHKVDQDEFKNLAKDPKYKSVHDELARWLPKKGAPEVRTESKYEHLRGPQEKK